MFSYVFADCSRELSELWQAHHQLMENSEQQTELIRQLRHLHNDTQNSQLTFCFQPLVQFCGNLSFMFSVIHSGFDSNINKQPKNYK